MAPRPTDRYASMAILGDDLAARRPQHVHGVPSAQPVLDGLAPRLEIGAVEQPLRRQGVAPVAAHEHAYRPALEQVVRVGEGSGGVHAPMIADGHHRSNAGPSPVRRRPGHATPPAGRATLETPPHGLLA